MIMHLFVIKGTQSIYKSDFRGLRGTKNIFSHKCTGIILIVIDSASLLISIFRALGLWWTS